jgi:hypothetical protein
VYHADIGRDGVVALAFFLITAALTLTGPGRFSLDGWIASRTGTGPTGRAGE